MTSDFYILIDELAGTGELPHPYADRLANAAALHLDNPEWRLAASHRLLRDSLAGLIPVDSAYCLAHRLLSGILELEEVA